MIYNSLFTRQQHFCDPHLIYAVSLPPSSLLWKFFSFEIIIIFNRSLLKQFAFIIYCLSFRRTSRYRLRFINLFLFDIVILYVCNLLPGIMSCMIYNVHVKELKFVDRLIFMDCS